MGLGELRRAMLMGLLVHKLPEGLVLGLLLRTAMRERWRALVGAAASQSAMLVGFLLPADMAITSTRANVWFVLANGSFLFLGAHAVHSEWRVRGPRVAMRSAVAGVAGSLVLAGVARLFSH
jgi:zinc transporter ZupT